jgi:SNF2 family DNA or RNA helicase
MLMIFQILHPFMLRRVKADVELSLPPKKELLVFTPLTPLQSEMYRAILNKTIHDLLRPDVCITVSGHSFQYFVMGLQKL